MGLVTIEIHIWLINLLIIIKQLKSIKATTSQIASSLYPEHNLELQVVGYAKILVYTNRVNPLTCDPNSPWNSEIPS